jgi:hypothetical protein
MQNYKAVFVENFEAKLTENGLKKRILNFEN